MSLIIADDIIAPVHEFIPFAKIPRLSRECVITEKIDGTNAQVFVTEDGQVLAGSRNRWITPEADNYGFARWVDEHKAELVRLGPGRHFGEWWGCGIQRGYDVPDKRFSLFDTTKWAGAANLPECCRVVPVLERCLFQTSVADDWIEVLRDKGSFAAPGFMRPEGVVVHHLQSRLSFKKTLEKDETYKGQS